MGVWRAFVVEGVHCPPQYHPAHRRVARIYVLMGKRRFLQGNAAGVRSSGTLRDYT